MAITQSTSTLPGSTPLAASAAPAPPPPAPPAAPGFHGAVSEFKRRLIESTLCQWGGNRTRTARALGLQRTYLLRLRPSRARAEGWLEVDFAGLVAVSGR